MTETSHFDSDASRIDSKWIAIGMNDLSNRNADTHPQIDCRFMLAGLGLPPPSMTRTSREATSTAVTKQTRAVKTRLGTFEKARMEGLKTPVYSVPKVHHLA